MNRVSSKELPSVSQDLLLFESFPGSAAAVLPDAPKFTVVAVTKDYQLSLGKTKEELVGKGYFEPFPVNPGEGESTGEKNVRSAFESAIKDKQRYEIPLQRYDIPSGNGTFIEKYWSAVVTPVLDEIGEVAYIILSAEHVKKRVNAEKTEVAHQNLEEAFRRLGESEQRFRALVKAASYVIYRMNADWTEMCELKGKGYLSDTDEPIKDWIEKYIHSADRVQVLRTVDDCIRNKSVFELEHRVTKQDGTVGWTLSRAIPILDEAGNIKEWFGAASDVSKRKQAEEALQAVIEETERQKRLYETITANTPDLVYVFDLNYRFTYANRALLEMWGKTWDEAVGKGLPENGYEPWHVEMHHREIDQVIATKRPIRGEVSFPHAVLGRRIYDYIFVPVINAIGEVEAIAGTTRDITEIRQAEESLRKSEKQQSLLLSLNDALTKLSDPQEIQEKAAAMVAHQLKAERVGYAEDTGDGKTVTITTDYTNGLPTLKGTYNYEDYGADLMKALTEGRTFVRNDIANDPALTSEEKAAHAALDLAATVNVPLVKDGRLFAIFFIHSTKSHEWSEEEVSLMQQVASRTWEAVMRARTEQSLRESEERFRIMANAVPQSMWITNAIGQTEFLNKHWCEYSGQAYTQTTASEIADNFIHPDDAPKVTEAFQRSMQTGEPFEVEQRNRSKDGEYRWFLNRGNPYIDPKTGKMSKWIGFGVDIHDRKVAEDALRKSEEALEKKVQERTLELEKANEELKRSNKNLEQFAYAASHDLKEPTRKINVFVERLEDSLKGRMSESEDNYFKRMKTASIRMNTLIDDLLAYSELERKTTLEEDVDLNLIVERVLSDLDLEIEQKHAKIEAGRLFAYKGNNRQLQQAFQNLIGNSLKYAKPGVPPVITIGCNKINGSAINLPLSPEEKEREFYEVTITDNGIGFEQEHADVIFNVFTRLHGMAEYKGTGIGLSIVRKVIQNHSGYVFAESRLGEGATFKVLLPVK